MKKQSAVRVVAAVIEQKGSVLIAKRAESDWLAGKWEFPGGKIEPGETPEQALKRELREELGITAEVGAHLCSSRFDYEHLSVELLAYRVALFTGEAKPLVHGELRWVRPGELTQYDFPEANLEIIRLLTA